MTTFLNTTRIILVFSGTFVRYKFPIPLWRSFTASYLSERSDHPFPFRFRPVPFHFIFFLIALLFYPLSFLQISPPSPPPANPFLDSSYCCERARIRVHASRVLPPRSWHPLPWTLTCRVRVGSRLWGPWVRGCGRCGDQEAVAAAGQWISWVDSPVMAAGALSIILAAVLRNLSDNSGRMPRSRWGIRFLVGFGLRAIARDLRWNFCCCGLCTDWGNCEAACNGWGYLAAHQQFHILATSEPSEGLLRPP
jgi:hypothetical protein